MDRPGTDSDIKQAFDSVDVDGGGLVEWSEFCFSLMGERALHIGALADLELLNTLLEDTSWYFIRKISKHLSAFQTEIGCFKGET